jgi:hypothetical protein
MNRAKRNKLECNVLCLVSVLPVLGWVQVRNPSSHPLQEESLEQVRLRADRLGVTADVLMTRNKHAEGIAVMLELEPAQQKGDLEFRDHLACTELLALNCSH